MSTQTTTDATPPEFGSTWRSDNTYRLKVLKRIEFILLIIIMACFVVGVLPIGLGSIWIFYVITALVLIAHFRFCHLRLYRDATFLGLLEKTKVADRKPLSQDTSDIISDIIENLDEILDDRNTEKEKFARFFVVPFKKRLQEIRDVLQYASQNPNIISHGLNNLERLSHDTSPFHAFSQMLINVILFSGIVGTFYGLLEFLTSNAMKDVLESVGKGSPDSKTIALIFKGFETAFGSSLLAYIAYVVSRFAQDLCDDDFDATMNYLAHNVQGRLALMFSMKPVIYVDLPSDTKAMMMNNLVQIIGLTKTLHDAAQEFSSALSYATGLGKQITEALETGRKDWVQASEMWCAATGTFSNQTMQFTGTVIRFQDESEQLLVEI